jgi:hypothetical protein
MAGVAGMPSHIILQAIIVMLASWHFVITPVHITSVLFL